MDLTELFCQIDDFYQDWLQTFSSTFFPAQGTNLPKHCQLAPSEVMTIAIHFHQSSYRTFKDYYTKYVCLSLSSHFPRLVSYNRMVELMPNVLIACLYYLKSRRGKSTGMSFVDSTAIPVCHPKRISRNKVFKETGKLGKSSMGWFYGFKLHLIINDSGEILSCQITPGNVDDRKPLPFMASGLRGKMFGDKGYISKEIFNQLFSNGLQLITPLKSNMKKRSLAGRVSRPWQRPKLKLVPMTDKLLLRKRSLIES